jgi:Bacterial archaeo-eukaryotic release factor family 10
MITAETIDRIAGFDGQGLPIVSAYVAVDPADQVGLRSRVSAMLHRIRPLAERESLSRAARLSVRADIENIENAVTRERWGSGAVALFSCSGGGMFEEVTLERRVRDRITVGDAPWVRPMLAVLGEHARSCVTVVDQESAVMWELYGKDIRAAGDVRDPIVVHPGRPEDRTANRVGERTKRHYRKVAGALDRLMAGDRLQLLVVGGHRHELRGFLDFLPRELRGRVVGTFGADVGTSGVAEIRSNACMIVERYERDRERRQVARAFETVAAGGLAVAGLAECLWAASITAAQLLLVQHDVVVPGVVCRGCGWLGLADGTCPVCGKAPVYTPDVLNELAESVIDAGGDVTHVQVDTELREHTAAAALRFPLPPRPNV